MAFTKHLFNVVRYKKEQSLIWKVIGSYHDTSFKTPGQDNLL